jgi:hypothetical protein
MKTRLCQPAPLAVLLALAIGLLLVASEQPAQAQSEPPNSAQVLPGFVARRFGSGFGNVQQAIPGDFDGDSHLDIAVLSETEPGAVFLNDGNAGFFADPIDCLKTEQIRCFGQLGTTPDDQGAPNAAFSPDKLATADMDGDGDLDLVVPRRLGQSAIYLNQEATFSYTLAVAEAAGGNSSFCGDASIRCFGPDSGIEALAVLDANGDGQLDLAAGVSDGQSAVYLNQGDTFVFHSGSPDCGDTERVRCFGPSSSLAVDLVAADFNHDGQADLALADWNQSAVYLNRDGSFTHGRSADTSLCTQVEQMHCFGAAFSGFGIVRAGDLNNDDLPDLMAGSWSMSFPASVVVFLNDPIMPGRFAFGHENAAEDSNYCDWPNLVHCVNPNGPRAQTMLLSNIDADNDLDLIVVPLFGEGFAYLNDGNANFMAAPESFLGERSNKIFAIVDLNDDGALDIIAEQMVFINDGSVDFAAGTEFESGRQAEPGEDQEGDPNISGFERVTGASLADLTGDTVLDLIVPASGASSIDLGSSAAAQAFIFVGDGAGRFSAALPFGGLNDAVSLALGNFDEDLHLDVVAVRDAHGPPLGNTPILSREVYVALNNGQGSFPLTRTVALVADRFTQPVVGDIDNDGRSDLILATRGAAHTLYFGDGRGGFPVSTTLPLSDTAALATGDLDGDGDLDIVAGSYTSNVSSPSPRRNTLLLNDGTGRFSTARDFGNASASFEFIAVADMDGDSDLDIVAGSFGQQSAVYLNDGAANFQPGALDCRDTARVRCFGRGTEYFDSLALADLNGDGATDIVAGFIETISDARRGLRTYVNDGLGGFATSRALPHTGREPINESFDNKVALGDLDGDGDTDVVSARSGQPHVLYHNHLNGGTRLPNNPPSIQLAQPGPIFAAQPYASASVLSDTLVPISYTLRDPEGDPVGQVALFYSLDGGGSWRPAAPTPDTQLVALATTTDTLRLDTSLRGTHVYTWDVGESSFFGRSDNVVVRLVAYATPLTSTSVPTGTFSYTNSVVGPIQRPYVAATSAPFRMRGTQVRVVDVQGAPLPDTLVLRRTYGEPDFSSIRDGAGYSLVTDAYGYLQGRGSLVKGDGLLALRPISGTGSYTIYQTSAPPSLDGVTPYTATSSGVQTLTITGESTLILFNLNVALEWDARTDTDQEYLAQLEADIKRASELLYDWTNGQAALGDIRIIHNAPLALVPESTAYAPSWWDVANVRVYATNRMRPSAVKGGVVLTGTADPDDPTTIYYPGFVRMGATWNRYGEASGSLNEDWPRALAHELGHYLFFLDDGYLGYDDNSLLVELPLPGELDCRGAMTDAYRHDYDEFQPGGEEWRQRCARTVGARGPGYSEADQQLGRSDWQTILDFYSHPELGAQLQSPAEFHGNPGPRVLPLDVTHIIDATPPDVKVPMNALHDLILMLADEAGSRIDASGARAFLLQQPDSAVVDLGNPTGNRVLVRGGRTGDRLCIFDQEQAQDSAEQPASLRVGCEILSAADQEIMLRRIDGWRPEILLTPQTSTTLVVSVPSASVGPTRPTSLSARLFPAQGEPFSASLELVGDVYSASLTLSQPSFSGFIHVWYDDPDPQARREIIVDYRVGGDPGNVWMTASRDNPGNVWMTVPRDFPGNVWMTAPLLSPDGQTLVYGVESLPQDQFYIVQTLAAAPDPPLWARVVGQPYRLASSAPLTEEHKMSISIGYLSRAVPDGMEPWLRVYYRSEGGSAWVPLSTTLNTYRNTASAPIVGLGSYALMASVEVQLKPGRNLLSFPISGTLPITAALASVDLATVEELRVEAFVPGTQTWQSYDLRSGTGDLKEISFGQALVIEVSQPVTLRLPGTAYLPTETGEVPIRVVAEDAENGGTNDASPLIWPEWWPLWLRDATLVGLLGVGLLALLGGVIGAWAVRSQPR